MTTTLPLPEEQAVPPFMIEGFSNEGIAITDRTGDDIVHAVWPNGCSQLQYEKRGQQMQLMAAAPKLVENLFWAYRRLRQVRRLIKMGCLKVDAEAHPTYYWDLLSECVQIRRALTEAGVKF